MSKQQQFLEAIRNQNSSVVKRLISHPKVDVNAKHLDGLVYAAQKGHLEICEWLIKHGADVNAKYKNGETATSAPF